MSYSDFGNTVNPKVQIRWQPVDETLTLRGSYSTSFRPPTFGDLYLADQESYPELRNPVRAALEEADPDGFDENTYPIFEQIRTIYSGNPDLEAETADNFTAGFVYSPPFVKRLNLSVDWFKIDQENIPGSVDQFILDQNFAGSDPNLPIAERPLDPGAPFSDQFVYNPNNQSYTVLYAPALNLSRRTVEGIDFRLTYELPTETAGTFTFAGDVSYYYKFEQENIPGEGMQDRLGDFIDPIQGFGLGQFAAAEDLARHVLELQQLRVRRDRLLHPQLPGRLGGDWFRRGKSTASGRWTSRPATTSRETSG